jgi:hypothetical protein
MPEGDCSDNQVYTAGSVALIFERAVANFAESVETDRPSQGIVCFARIDAGGDRPS